MLKSKFLMLYGKRKFKKIDIVLQVKGVHQLHWSKVKLYKFKRDLDLTFGWYKQLQDTAVHVLDMSKIITFLQFDLRSFLQTFWLIICSIFNIWTWKICYIVKRSELVLSLMVVHSTTSFDFVQIGISDIIRIKCKEKTRWLFG